MVSFLVLAIILLKKIKHARYQMGGRGSRPPPPLKNRNAIGFLSNTGPDPLKITKLPSQHSMSGHHWHTSETSFKWRDNGPPLVVLDPFSPHHYKTHTKNVARVGPPLTKLSGSAHLELAASLQLYCGCLRFVCLGLICCLRFVCS